MTKLSRYRVQQIADYSVYPALAACETTARLLP
jgi:hypothetical protein